MANSNRNFNNQFSLSLEDRISFLINIRNFSTNTATHSFYFSKKNGFSLFFQMPAFYISCIQCLWNFSILPIVENNSDKFSYGFRPFRSVQDLFFEIKNSFLKKKLFLWIINFKFNFYANLSDNYWLLKNFPMEKKILKSWFNPTFFRSFPCIDNSNIFFSLINFSVNGLVLIFITGFSIVIFK